MSAQVQCWRCGAVYQEDVRSLPRAAECAACHADLHVCKMCKFYDTRIAKHCREPIAEEVKDKERANFCAYLTVRMNAFSPDSQPNTDAARARLDALFGGAKQKASGLSDSDAARAALDDLFGSQRK